MNPGRLIIFHDNPAGKNPEEISPRNRKKGDLWNKINGIKIGVSLGMKKSPGFVQTIFKFPKNTFIPNLTYNAGRI